ncbi:MAG: DUF3955 domain-containing protein [Clostridia bacterium]|nr:DUF3955 domain-containing protein [Clostridia bacterium]
MKKYLFISLPFLLGIICFSLYNLKGIQIADDGTLIESFFYIPLGYLCFAVGLLMLMIQPVLALLQPVKRKKLSNE